MTGGARSSAGVRASACAGEQAGNGLTRGAMLAAGARAYAERVANERARVERRESARRLLVDLRRRVGLERAGSVAGSWASECGARALR